MKTKKTLNKLVSIIALFISLTLICWDFATSSDQFMEEGTFRYESEFDAISSATPDVGIVPSDYNGLSKQVSRNQDLDFSHIQEMVDKAIELSGGFDGIIEKNNTVMIKVNLVQSNSPSGFGENTDVNVVKALIKNIYDFTEGAVEIIVAEGTARSNDDPASTSSVWEYSGYRDLLTDPYLDNVNFKLLNLNQSVGDLTAVDLQEKATSAAQGTSTYHIHKEEYAADVYIAVPVLKIHDTGITNALKLQIGTAPGCWYGYNKKVGTTNSIGIQHDDGLRRWTTEAIVDLSTAAGIDFVVVDAIMCLQEFKNGGNQVRMNTIVACEDPVATDHVCAKLFSLNPDDIAHITLAEKIGLGTNQADQIDIFGASIESVKKIVTKNPTMHGQWGQSNCTWLLSKTFPASGIEDEAIPDEATYEAEAGKDNWSEAVYFFDDRIDLSSFYNNAKDVVTYAFSYFFSPKDQTAELWLGHEEGTIVYINGEEVYKEVDNLTYNDLGKEVKKISIKAGENTLLVKTYNIGGDYCFALNICEDTDDENLNGNRVDGLKFYTVKGTVNTKKVRKDNFNIGVFPNPCSDNATIKFSLPKTMHASIDLFDVNGKMITNIDKGIYSIGNNQISWNVSDMNGNKIQKGIYICVINAGNFQKNQRIIVQ